MTMLSDIYNWFIEGFDTADLKEAKSLLNELKRVNRRSGRAIDGVPQIARNL